MNNVIVPIERAGDGALIVSSVTIAEGAGVEHRAVLQLISTHAADLEQFGTVAFEMRPLPGGGNPLRIAMLNEQQATLVMTYQRNTDQVRAFKVALVKAFFEMAQQLAARPAELSRMQILELAMAAEREVQELKEARAQDAPKVAYVDRFVADDDKLRFKTVAGDLGISESELRAELIKRKWIYVEATTRWSESKQEKVTVRRYSPMADKRDYFHRVLNHDAPRFRGEVMHTLKITPSGAAAIARMYGRMAVSA